MTSNINEIGKKALELSPHEHPSSFKTKVKRKRNYKNNMG